MKNSITGILPFYAIGGCHIFRVLLYLVIVLFVFTSTDAYAHIDVTPQQAKDLIDANDPPVVVDVREDYEYCDEEGHIPGALNFPLNSGILYQRYTELSPTEPVLVICRGGFRSNLAANFLDDQGFTTVYDMTGGMNAWLWETVTCMDSDLDGINDDLDNCPYIYNPSQLDADQDGIGNPCDIDYLPSLFVWDRIDFFDVAVLAGTWQQQGEGLPADLDKNGLVDFGDLVILADYWLVKRPIQVISTD